MLSTNNLSKEIERKINDSFESGKLNLSSTSLSKIPDLIFNPNSEKWWNVVDLTKLSLNQNNLSCLDTRLFDLIHLLFLDLSNNCLKTIPEEISQLSSLTHFNVSGNSISTIPSSLINLPIITIDLSRNQISNVSRLFEIKCLVDVKLDHNTLKNISISHNLTSLSISNNSLESVDLALNNCNSLDLSHNNLVSFSADLVSLKTLDLKQNLLVSLDILAPNLISLCTSFNKLEEFNIESLNLEQVDLRGNLLKFLPECILEMKRLKRLDLGDNCISSLDPRLGLLELDFLNVNGNLLKGFHGLSVSKMLSILKNRMPQSDPIDLVNNSKQAIHSQQQISSKTADFSGLDVKDFAKDDIKLQFNPTNISATQNKLVLFPKSFEIYSSSLSTINLSSNKITRFPDNVDLPLLKVGKFLI